MNYNCIKKKRLKKVKTHYYITILYTYLCIFTPVYLKSFQVTVTNNCLKKKDITQSIKSFKITIFSLFFFFNWTDYML